MCSIVVAFSRAEVVGALQLASVSMAVLGTIAAACRNGLLMNKDVALTVWIESLCGAAGAQ